MPATPLPENRDIAKVRLIDDMNQLPAWAPSFCDTACGGANGRSNISLNLVPGMNGDAIEILHDLQEFGWVVISINIDAGDLAGTDGIKFMFKGSGSPNTFELRLTMRYTEDSVDTVLGIAWHRATSANDAWISLEAPYLEFSCWWPADLCELHGDNPELNHVRRIDFAVSNKPEFNDAAGVGKAVLDDVQGLQP